MGTLALILVPAALMIGIAVAVMVVRERTTPVPGRPWWGSPAVWVGVSAAFLVVGLFVFPRLLGFTFLFLPLLWIGGLGRRRRDDEDHHDR